MIKRYDILENGTKVPEPDGEWMRYENHIHIEQERDALKARCEKLEEMVKVMKTVLEDSDKYLEYNEMTSIGHCSILHAQMKEALSTVSALGVEKPEWCGKKGSLCPAITDSPKDLKLLCSGEVTGSVCSTYLTVQTKGEEK